MIEHKVEDKGLKVLKKMKEMLCKNEYLEFQERFRRIHKSLLAIEKHESYLISNFSFEVHNEELKEEEEKEKTSQANLNSSLTKIKIGSDLTTDESLTQIVLEDLLSSIERQLNIPVSSESNRKNSSGLSSSSSDEDNKNSPDKKKDSNSGTKFKTIKERVTAYLKQVACAKNNDTLSETNTPVTKLTANSRHALPALLRNFFDDKGILEEAKKRYSWKEDGLRNHLAQMANIEQIYKCKSNEVKTIRKKERVCEEEISFFSLDMPEDSKEELFINGTGDIRPSLNFGNVSGIEKMERSSFNFSKRESIFKERFLYEFPIREEDAEVEKLEEVMSETSDSEEENE